MNKKIISIIIAIIFGSIVLLVYNHLRINYFENYIQGFIGLKISKNVKILKHKLELNSSKNLKTKKLENLLKQIVENDKKLALIALSDSSYNIEIIAKNDRIINSQLLDIILKDFSKKRLIPETKLPLIIKYYNNIKFYFYVDELKNNIIVLAYKFFLPQKILIKLLIENFIILFILIIFTIIIGLKINKEQIFKNKIKKQKVLKVKKEKVNKKNILKNIIKEYELNLLNIYKLKNNKPKLLYKYPKKTKLNLKFDNEIISELKQGIPFLINLNKTLLFYDNTNNIIIYCSQSKPFEGNKINKLMNELPKQLNQLIK